MKTDALEELLDSPKATFIEDLSPTLLKFMQDFQTWWELVQLVYKSSEKLEEMSFSYEKAGSSNVDINVEMQIKSAFDKYGHAIANGMTCPVCGKKLKYVYPSGYCSGACFLKDVTDKVAPFLMSPNDKYAQLFEILDTIALILDKITLILNAIMSIPDILAEITEIPQRYKDYVNQKINEGFCLLQVKMNELLIKKNDAIKKLFSKAKLGVITKPIAKIFSAIEAVQAGIDSAKKTFEETYSIIITALEGLKVSGVCIPAESFAALATPRSVMSALPYAAPDASKIFVTFPGGSGAQNLNVIKPLLPSAMTTVDLNSLNTMIQSAFPPLQTAEYYMEPELFAVRYKLSDQSDVVPAITSYLQDYLSAGPDYLPKFENMLPIKEQTILGKKIPMPNIGYIWFLMGLADGWAPHSQALIGSIIHPEV